MRKENKYTNVIYILEIIFKIGFMLYSMLSFCSLSYGKTVISYILWPVVIFGIFLCLWRCMHIRDYLSSPGLWFLVLFTISYLISMICNLQYGYKEGIIKLIFLCFYFYLYYLVPTQRKSLQRRKEFYVVSAFFMVYMAVGCMVSIILMATGYHQVYTVADGWDIGIGLIWGRLWGVFTEPNYAAVCAGIGLLLSFYYLHLVKKKMCKITLWINIVIGILYISFSDSRTGAVVLGVTAAVYTFNRLNRKRIIGQKGSKQVMIAVVASFGILVGFLFVPSVIKNGYNISLESVNKVIETDDELVKLDRGYSLESDPSNRRFSIWQAGIELYQTSPIVGVSFSNILAYTQENCKDSYLINNSKGSNFSTIHNELLNVLVGQGTIGILILLIFIIQIMRTTFSGLYIGTDEEFEYKNMLFTGIMGLAAGAMFLTGMFYSNLPNAIMFWCMLGEYMNEISCEKEEKRI